jgi:hypothetical protein
VEGEYFKAGAWVARTPAMLATCLATSCGLLVGDVGDGWISWIMAHGGQGWGVSTDKQAIKGC